jgi:hypothetical protein
MLGFSHRSVWRSERAEVSCLTSVQPLPNPDDLGQLPLRSQPESQRGWHRYVLEMPRSPREPEAVDPEPRRLEMAHTRHIRALRIAAAIRRVLRSQPGTPGGGLCAS